LGKSIFYNERIETTSGGLVQVLLVDGSTFTVGAGSDLVIGKFVNDPKKTTGKVTAAFSKASCDSWPERSPRMRMVSRCRHRPARSPFVAGWCL